MHDIADCKNELLTRCMLLFRNAFLLRRYNIFRLVVFLFVNVNSRVRTLILL